MFGRGMMLAIAGAAMLSVPAAAPSTITIRDPAPAVIPKPAHRLRSDRKKAQRRQSEGKLHARGNKLWRRLQRKHALGMNGSF